MSIEIEHLSYTYSPKTPFEHKALDDISFTIREGETVGIIGTTGSGKSTLIQHLNGLIRVQSGKLTVCGVDLTVKKPDWKTVRSRVGMLFQYPEYQLFADTVLKDVCFGPINFGMTEADAKVAAQEALESVGLNFDEVKEKSPFELSGGQKRRVALAGVIASKPSVLVLDEPTAGLDPVGKKEILGLVRSLKRDSVKTVVMISHNMDEIAEYTDRVIVLHDSKLIADAPPRELFASFDTAKTGLDLPHTVKIQRGLERQGFYFSKLCLTPEELAAELGAR